MTTTTAPVIFKIEATPLESQFGYMARQSYTFTFTTGKRFAPNAESVFTPHINLWTEEEPSHGSLWSSLGGTGLSGLYIQPTGAKDRHAFVDVCQAEGRGTLNLFAGNEGDLGLGVFTPGAWAVRYLHAQLPEIERFTFPGSHADPTSYFAGYYGTYTPGAGAQFSVTTVGQGALNFTPTRVSIAPAVSDRAASAASPSSARRRHRVWLNCVSAPATAGGAYSQAGSTSPVARPPLSLRPMVRGSFASTVRPGALKDVAQVWSGQFG